jgi:hypothetical protein
MAKSTISFGRLMFGDMSVDEQIELLTFLTLGLIYVGATGNQKMKKMLMRYFRDADISKMRPDGQRIVRGLIEIFEAPKSNRLKAK